MASITLRSVKGSPLTNAEVDANFSNINVELGQKEVASNKGVAGGYAALDGTGKVPTAQLPSFVDDVLEAANFAALPATGETGKLYVTLDNAKVYRWSGTAYVEISPSPGSSDAVPEGSTNLYFTSARARNAISVSGSLGYNASTGVISYSTPTITVSGDASGSGTTSLAITLANTGVAAGTYTKLTVDAKGRVTAGAALASGDLPTYTGTLASSQVTTALGYAPPQPTGGGASGNWSINISGSASALGGYTSDLQTVVGTGDYLLVRNQATTKIQLASAASVAAIAQSGASGTWSISVTGNAATVSSITSGQVTTALGYTPYNATNPSGYITGSASITGASRYVTFLDTRAVNDQPQGKQGYALSADFKEVSVVGSPPTAAGAGFAHVITIAGWDTAGGSGGWPSQISVGDGLAVRQATSATAWGAWRNVLHSNNYTSYSPTLTGGGASGTWGINVSGSAGSLSGYGNPTTAVTGNTIAYRDGNGDLATRELTLTSTLWSLTPTVLTGLYPGTNQLVRMTPAAVAASMGALTTSNYTSYSPSLTGGGASGTWGINVTGSAGAVAWSNVSGKPTLPASQEGTRFTTDLNALLSTGFFNAEAVPANTPSGSYGNIIVARGIDTGMQIYGGYLNDGLWFRGWHTSGATMTPWRRVAHDGASITWSADNTYDIGASGASRPRTVYVATHVIAGGSIVAGTGTAGATGEIRATDNITAYFSSDRRLKTNVQPIADALAKVAQIHGVEFDWTDEYIEAHGGEDGYFIRKRDVGVIAQEIQAVLPEAVAEKADGHLAVRYERVVPLLIEAVKALSLKVQQLERA